MNTAARTYYEACQGTWRSPIALTVTDSGVLARSGMSWADRMSVRLLSSWPRWLGRVYMHTLVVIDGDDVVHTTTVRWLGLPLSRTVEIFALDPDGLRFTVRGSMTGAGAIDATATRGEYTLRWLGVEIRQRTVREPDRVTVHQEGPGFTGVQDLQRQS